MSGLVTGIVLDRYPNGGGERLVAVALADNAHRDGTHIFPSVAEIAERTKLSRRAVQMDMAKMVAAGWLILTRKSTGRRGDTNEYRICPAWLAGGQCTPPSAPVLRTNAKRPKPWGANIAPHESAPWGANSDAMGCNPTHDGVKPIAPKPSGTVIGTNPLPPAGGAPGFENFFAGYPRQVDETRARREWDKLAPDAQLQGEIARAVQAWIRSPEWQRESGRFIPKPSNWLRGKRWRDVPGNAAPPPPPPAPPIPPPPELTPEHRAANRERARAAARLAREVLGAKGAVATC